jgi:sporulation integral membrane protein YlbJ
LDGENMEAARGGQTFKALAISTVTVLMILLILAFPAEVISASKEGLMLWFNQVLPSLLPFMIGVNILYGVGFINFFGRLLSPVMRPLFGVPGEGGFALAAGMASGYPMGSKISSMLRESGALTKTEAQRLLSFTNNAGPLFILGAVGAAMFRDERIGRFLMAAHYSGAIITGLLFSFYKRSERPAKLPPGNILTQALSSMAKTSQNKTLGALLADSVLSGIESIGLIGGFIIFFNVAARAFSIAASIDNPMLKAMLTGFIEITNGVNSLSASQGKIPVIAAAGIISFGGLSIFAQSLSFISKTDLSPRIYLMSKFLHCAISVALALAFYPKGGFPPQESVNVWADAGSFYLQGIAISWVAATVCSLAGICLAAYAIKARRLATSR